MTQTPQRPPSSNTAANKGAGAPSAPPMPPPPPTASSTLSTQRQSTQTIEMPNGSRGLTNPAAHRPGAPPPMARNIPSNSSQPTFEQLIKEAHEKGFSDIHLGVGEIPRFRNRGEINATEYPETDKETFMSWLRETLTEEEIKRF